MSDADSEGQDTYYTAEENPNEPSRVQESTDLSSESCSSKPWLERARKEVLEEMDKTLNVLTHLKTHVCCPTAPHLYGDGCLRHKMSYLTFAQDYELFCASEEVQGVLHLLFKDRQNPAVQAITADDWAGWTRVLVQSRRKAPDQLTHLSQLTSHVFLAKMVELAKSYKRCGNVESEATAGLAAIRVAKAKVCLDLHLHIKARKTCIESELSHSCGHEELMGVGDYETALAARSKPE